MFILVIIISLSPFNEETVTKVFQTGRECRKIEAKAKASPTAKIKSHCSMVI